MKLQTPYWTKDAIIYQIFPDRFFNGNKNNDPKNTVCWNSEPTRDNFFGGDLEGIKLKLDYLQDIGINCIYLTPIFEASTNHKYDTKNYYKIDPAFGDEKIFKDLVQDIHRRGMKIILDGVFNHCGLDHPFFVDASTKGNNSEYWDWFWINDIPIKEKPEPNYRCFAGYSKMPEWNLQNIHVQEYLLDVVKYWIKEADIDGWRLDTVEYLEPTFVKKIREESKKIKPDAFVLGEILHLGTSWFKGECLDGAMNYRLWDYSVSFFAKNEMDARTFADKIYVLRASYLDWANYSMYNLPDSHDRPRIMTLCDGDKRKVKLLFGFLFTYIGIPVLYYGDEIGMMGKNDPDCRRSMIWETEKQDKDLFEYIKKLIQLRKNSKALKMGKYKLLFSDESVFAFEREYGEEKIEIYINNSEKEKIVPLKTKIDEIFITENCEVKNKKISLGDYGILIYSKKR